MPAISPEVKQRLTSVKPELENAMAAFSGEEAQAGHDAAQAEQSGFVELRISSPP